MKLEKKVYTTRAEKQNDFGIGIGIFLGLNVLLFMISSVILGLMTIPATNYTSDVATILPLMGVCIFYVLPFLANIVAVIYFALTRTWIAIGMLGTFGFLLILGLILGVIATLVCFTTGNTGF